ncbi:MAG: DEAD/DEAH box helicase [Gammaproteobacteria bacterium]|nr:DEAD/DEAH box helicase [Gammaproteobacteria bacterium]MDX5375230.1 DEAD/DEAH box helicase [Gammaproteobacteria bacterium]
MSAASDTPDTPVRFADFDLAPAVLRAVEEVGYETPSPIQAATLPPLLAGRDLLGMAQTGTGKTAAFALPLLSRLDLSRAEPQLLVLTPTRELAIQVAEAMQRYARHLPGFHILPVYGGQGMDVQLRQLRRGVHVVVGTPGRVQDHLRRKTLKLDTLSALVLDEADEMLRMGFIDDVEQILEHTPSERQIALFSATMPEPIRRVTQKYLRDPVEIRIQAKTKTVTAITQRYWQVSGTHKLDALTRILEVEDFDGIIIFVRTKTATVELAEKLEARGYSAAPLNGDITQQMREKTVERLKSGAIDIIVGTDVVARGLDVPRISHVINYDIPYDTEAYIHRIGRTGRAGRTGDAILFVAPRETRMLRAIEKATGQPITPMQLPSREAITGKRVGQFKQLITDTLEGQELGYYEELIEGYQAEHNIGLAEIAAALAYLVQRERPLKPRADEVPEVAAARPPAREREDARRDPRQRARRDEGAEPRDRDRAGPEPGMMRYRIEVGRSHGAEPKHIVGAIANEAGIESRYIGRIKLFDDFSVIELPDGMPKHVFQHLKNVWVCGRKLNITPDQGPAGGKSAGERPAFKKPGFKKPAGDRPGPGKGKGKRRDNAAGKGRSRP